MLRRFEVGLLSHVRDVVGERVARKIRNELGIAVERVRLVRVYTVEGLPAERLDRIPASQALHDPVLHVLSDTPLAEGFDWIIEVGFRPGVTDNEGRTARETLVLALGLPPEEARDIKVYTSVQYLISGALSEADAARIGRDLLANDRSSATSAAPPPSGGRNRASRPGPPGSRAGPTRAWPRCRSRP